MLTKEREAAVLSIEQLAERAGLSRQTVIKTENGRRPRQTTIQKLARGLGISPKRLRSLRDLPVSVDPPEPRDYSDLKGADSEE